VIATGLDPSFLAYLSFTFILVVTPGSTTAVVVRNTLEGGRRAGYATAFGAALANISIAVVCGLGLSVLIAFWPGSLSAIQIAGGLFLAFLGVSSLWRAWHQPDVGIRMPLEPGAPARSSAGAYFGDGLAINLLSPVIISFYLSVVPTFIPAGASRLYYPLLASSHVGLAFLCHSAWATGLHAMRRWFIAPWTRRLLQTLTGLALIGLSARVIL